MVDNGQMTPDDDKYYRIPKHRLRHTYSAQFSPCDTMGMCLIMYFILILICEYAWRYFFQFIANINEAMNALYTSFRRNKLANAAVGIFDVFYCCSCIASAVIYNERLHICSSVSEGTFSVSVRCALWQSEIIFIKLYIIIGD